MLTRPYIHFRRRSGKIYPVFLNLEDARLTALAEDLLHLYRSGAEERLRRGELEEPVEALCRGSGMTEVAEALTKLVEDRCLFHPARELDYPTVRRQLLMQSAALLWHEGSAEEYQRAWRAAPAAAVFAGDDLYGDLPENEILGGFRDLTARELLERYNLAQVQGLLMRAQRLKLRVSDPETGELRRFFKYLKFFRLLSEIRRVDSETLELEISGPFAIFANSRKYALQLAGFFPAVVLLKKWKLSADICWNEGREEWRLVLDESCGLRSHYRNFSSYVPEEISLFHRHFREKVRSWQVAGETPFLDGPEGRVFFPDLCFRRKPDGPAVYLELFHRWHRTELERRLAFLAAQPEIPLLIGVDRALADETTWRRWEEQYPELVQRMFQFRDFPGVDRVRRLLDTNFPEAMELPAR